MLGAVSEILATLGFSDFVVRLNHRQVLTGLLEIAGVPAPQHGDALVALDKLDKIGAEGVSKEFAARGIPEAAGGKALAFFAASRGAPGAGAGPADGAAGWPRGRREPRRDRPARGIDPCRRPDPARSEPRARAVILHGRDHGDRGATGLAASAAAGAMTT